MPDIFGFGFCLIPVVLLAAFVVFAGAHFTSMSEVWFSRSENFPMYAIPG